MRSRNKHTHQAKLISMKILKILIPVSALFVFSTKSHAQNIATTKLNWSSVATFNPMTGETVSEATQLFTTAGDSIQWKAPNGTLRYGSKILEVNGSWTDVSQAGSITYEVDSNGMRGVITLERSSDLKVRMMLTTATDPQAYELTINLIQLF